MPTIQTYEARNIREGDTVHHQQCRGQVLQAPETAGRAGTVTVVIQCRTCGEQHLLRWPAHGAVHAERTPK